MSRFLKDVPEQTASFSPITLEGGRFAYDAHERLTTEHYKTPQAATLFRYDYTYDDEGNRYRKEYRASSDLRVYYSDTTGSTSDGENDELGQH